MVPTNKSGLLSSRWLGKDTYHAKVSVLPALVPERVNMRFGLISIDIINLY